MERVFWGMMIASGMLVIVGMLIFGVGWVLTWDFSFLWGPEVDTPMRWVRFGALLVIGGCGGALVTLLLHTLLLQGRR